MNQSISYDAQWVTIANRALIRIGAEPISALDDGTSGANFSTQLLPQSVETVYSAYHWRVASKRAQLSPLTTSPAYGYTYEFALPVDFAQVREVECASPYAVSDNKIITDAIEVYISYLPLPSAPTDMPIVLRDLVVRQLAYLLSIPILRSEGTTTRLLQEYQQAFGVAVTLDNTAQYRDDPIIPYHDEVR